MKKSTTQSVIKKKVPKNKAVIKTVKKVKRPKSYKF